MVLYHRAMADSTGAHASEKEAKQVQSVKPNVYWCVHVSCLFGSITRSDDRHPASEPPTQNSQGFETIVNI